MSVGGVDARTLEYVPIYVFFDESGNLDFSPTGSRYYAFGALTTTQPEGLNHALIDLRYDFLAKGLELERFHATDDRQTVRNDVFALLERIGNFSLDILFVDKTRISNRLKSELDFYHGFGWQLLHSVLKHYSSIEDRIVVITDALPLKRTRRAAEKAFKAYLRHYFPGRPFVILHHRSAAHPGLQAVDYCLWAMHRKWQRADVRSYGVIAPYVRSEIETSSLLLEPMRDREG